MIVLSAAALWCVIAASTPLVGFGVSAIALLLAGALVVGIARPATPTLGPIARGVRAMKLPPAVFVGAGVVTASGLLGAVVGHRAEVARIERAAEEARALKTRCTHGRAEVTTARRSGDDDALLHAASEIEDACKDIPAGQALEDEVRGRREATRIEREKKETAARWVTDQPRVGAALREAAGLVAQGKVLEADSRLDDGAVVLRTFEHSEVEHSLDFQDLAARMSEAKTKLAPRVAVAKAQKERAAAAAAAVAAASAARQEAAARAATPLSERSLVCRDGSTSSCSCAGSHRGCCSHHGGVAGCE